MDQGKIRNFSIIAHIDHGKSTLADRILEVTDTVTGREMREQVLDSMDLERERGITIKAQAVRVHVEGPRAEPDRHARATSTSPTRSRARSRPARARCSSSTPRRGSRRRRSRTPTSRSRTTSRSSRSSNKIDLPQADPDGVAIEVAELIGGDPADVLRISAKTGDGVVDVLDAIVERIPAPAGDPAAPPRALIFDSSYDQYRGVVAFVRVVDGALPQRRRACARWRRARVFDAEELGFMSPTMRPVKELTAGEVGYVITGLKDVSRAPGRRHAHLRRAPGRRAAARATRTSSRWSSPASSRPTPTSTRSSATRSRS